MTRSNPTFHGFDSETFETGWWMCDDIDATDWVVIS